jgi:hypothetical protein
MILALLLLGGWLAVPLAWVGLRKIGRVFAPLW